MKALLKGSRGSRVKSWQNFLVGQNLQDALSPEIVAKHVNVEGNGFGREPARVGEKNCARELVEIANDNGFLLGRPLLKKAGRHALRGC